MDLRYNRRFRQPPSDLAVAMQFWATMTPKDFSQPEKDLMLAVLTDAIRDYRSNLSACNARFREARRWLFGPNESLFSFESICEILELNPALIRRKLLELAPH